MVIEDLHAHVRPPAPDDTIPPPTVPVRQRDLLRYRARMKGYEAMEKRAKGQRPSFMDFSAGLDVMNEYVRTWERRKSALDEVL